MSSNAIAKQNTKPIAVQGNDAALGIFTDYKTFAASFEMAKCLSTATVVPKDYQNNPGNCMIAIDMARRLNANPLMVMQNLYIVNGRPAWSSQWIIAMINSSKRYSTELQFDFGYAPEDGGLSCQAWAEDYNGHRVNGPKITMKMATDEGWACKNGSKWKTMKEVMIQYRAASFFGRMNCPDMIMGIYSAEEAYDIGEYEEIVSDIGADMSAGTTVDESTGEVIDDAPITDAQRRSIFNMAKNHLGKDYGNQVVKEIIYEFGIERSTDLKASQFTAFCDRLTQRIEAEEASAHGDVGENGAEDAPAAE